MLSSAENYQFPVLVEQMTYRTQLEKNEFLCNNWTFNDVLVRLLDIIAYPIKSKIENIHNRCGYSLTSINTGIHQKLIDNCCHLLARVLSEIIFQSAPEVCTHFIWLVYHSLFFVWYLNSLKIHQFYRTKIHHYHHKVFDRQDCVLPAVILAVLGIILIFICKSIFHLLNIYFSLNCQYVDLQEYRKFWSGCDLFQCW